MIGPLHRRPVESDAIASPSAGPVIKIIKTWPELASLAAEWNGLLSRSRADTVFLRWEWIHAWMDVAGNQLEPLVITVRDTKGRLVGVAPFYVAAYRLLNLATYRVLRILGDFPTGAEYLDWIVDKDQEAAVSARIGQALRECRDQWDGIWMPYTSGWTGASERIEEACKEAGLLYRARPAQFAYLDLPRTFSEFLEARSGHWRHELRRKERKVFRHADVSFDRCSSEDELQAYLDGLFELHFLRWQLKGEQGTFRRKPNEARFYRRFAPVALRNGWLRLYAIRERGAFKVAQIGYAYNGVLHGLQDGFDPSFAPGAGIVLRAKVIEACIAEGLHGYDFLGEMSDHKARWLATERTGQDVFIAHSGLKSRILQAGDVWPTGRYLRLDRNAQRLQTGAAIPSSGPESGTG